MNAAARRRGGLEGALRKLAMDFRRFDFGTQQARNGTSLAAVRRKPDEPGIYAVITDSEDEMREALREDACSPPGEAHSGGG